MLVYYPLAWTCIFTFWTIHNIVVLYLCKYQYINTYQNRHTVFTTHATMRIQCLHFQYFPKVSSTIILLSNLFSILLHYSTYYSLVLSVCLFTIHILKYLSLALFIIWWSKKRSDIYNKNIVKVKKQVRKTQQPFKGVISNTKAQVRRSN